MILNGGPDRLQHRYGGAPAPGSPTRSSRSTSIRKKCSPGLLSPGPRSRARDCRSSLILRSVSFPMIVAAARWLAVAQVLFAPLAAPAPLWLGAALVGYALVATALAAMPRLSKRPQDRKDELPEAASG